MSRVALIVLAGCVLGLSARLADDSLPRWVGNVGAIWFLSAFLVGRLSRRRAYGARYGATCLVAAAVTYYLWRVFADETISLGFLLTVGVFWLLMAVVAGAIAGWFGARSHRSEHLWGIPAGVFVGEAVAVALRSARGSQIAVEVGLAVVCLVAARGSFKRASWLALFTALPVGLVSLVYRSWLA